jgi:O-succinylbenzoic acid--CoA ligase
VRGWGPAIDTGGQAISAIYVPLNASEEQLQSALANNLSKYKRPKHWVAVETLPRNAQGKIDRSQITKLIQQQIEQL